jgi:DNA-directed RNA polymerase subunit E'/Rpb7
MINQIKQKVSIESKYLDSNIRQHILDKLKNTVEGKCTLDNGYIIDIQNIIKLGDNKIGCANSLVIFDVIYQAITLKPEKGDILCGEVCMIFQQGIFVNVKGKMKVIVPATSMSSYTYNQVKNVFENDDNLISEGIQVNIEIIMTKYEKKQFNCIGRIV